jgi:hypothetical protein
MAPWGVRPTASRLPNKSQASGSRPGPAVYAIARSAAVAFIDSRWRHVQ